MDGSLQASPEGAAGASEVRIPDGITPIVAYRLWWLDPGMTLRSVSAPGTWAVGQWVEASCLKPGRGRHPAPSSGCTCGIYAVKTRRQASELLAEVSAFRPSAARRGLVVCGVVELAGTIIEHDRGFRAERARIVEFLPIRGARRRTAKAAASLGVGSGELIGPPRDPLGLMRRARWRYLGWQRRTYASRRGDRQAFPWMAAWLLLILVLRVGSYLLSLKP